MGEPDALSRRADHGRGQEDNKGVVLLDPSVFQIHALRATLVRGQEVDILRDIRECMEEEGTTEEPVAAAAQRLRRARATGQVHKTEWDETDGLLTFNGRIYVPDSKDLRQRIIAQYHNSRVAGHPGRMKTLEVDLPGLLVASDRETCWVLHPDVRGMSPEQGNPSSSYRGTQPDPPTGRTMGTGQRGLHRGTSGLARLRCNHGRSGFRDEAASLHPD